VGNAPYNRTEPGQYYYADIEQDTKGISPLALGGWIRILHQFWHHRHKNITEFDGTLTGDINYWRNIIGGSIEDTKKILSELLSAGIPTIFQQNSNKIPQKFQQNSTIHNGNITLGCRRIIREQKTKESNRLRQERDRKRKLNNGKITLLSQPPNATEDSSPKNPKNPKSPKKKEKRKKKERVFTLPECVPEDAWNGYIEVRKDKKYPMTVHALQLLLRKLEQFRKDGHKLETLINEATVRGWRSIFLVQDLPKAQKNTGAHVGQYNPGEEKPMSEADLEAAKIELFGEEG
jgi:hypothetical protein